MNLYDIADVSQIDKDITNNKKMSANIEKFYNILRRYRNGEFGDRHMSLAEILESANESELLNKMDISEIQYLLDNSSGMMRMLFSELKKHKLDTENQVSSSKLVLSKNENIK